MLPSVRRRFAVVTTLTLLGLAGSCGAKKGSPNISAFPIGQRVEVGKLIYRVLEAEWKAEIPGAKTPPKNRFLQLRLAITNSANQEISVPFLRLIDAHGQERLEFSDIETNARWLGSLRRLQPALTEDGLIYFDVPVGAYKLEVVDNSDSENEKAAFVDIPASLAPPPVSAGPASGSGM